MLILEHIRDDKNLIQNQPLMENMGQFLSGRKEMLLLFIKWMHFKILKKIVQETVKFDDQFHLKVVNYFNNFLQE